MGTAALILAAIAMICFMAAGVCVVSARGESWAGAAMWAVAAGLVGGVSLILSAFCFLCK